LQPTDGKQDYQQMVDKSEKGVKAAGFDARWKQALEMNGLTNPQMASLLGEYGQQNINAWRNRGQVGSRSLVRVSELLPRTNMMWLQSGTGEPERSSSGSHSVREPKSPSYVARPDPAMLASAIKLARLSVALTSDDDADPFDPEDEADSEIVSQAFAYLSARGQRAVTADNVVEFARFMRQAKG
jgi:hypothetical protein